MDLAEILIVDDEPLVRRTVERLLQRAGHRVVLAANAAEALEIVAKRPTLQLVVSDVMMDAMHGPELVARIREIRPDLPAVFMSGETPELLAATELPADAAFVGKPFEPHELLEAIERALTRAR